MQNTQSRKPITTTLKRPLNSHGSSRAISMPKLAEMKELVRKDGDVRLLVIISLASMTLRISDILSLRIHDLYGADMVPLDQLKIKERKTGKTKLVPLLSLHPILNEFANGLSEFRRGESEPVFLSQKQRLPLSRTSVNRMLADYGKRILLPQCSPHSFRKGTARYLVLEKGYPLSIVSRLLNHQSERVSSIYLDLVPSDLDAAFRDIQV